MLVNQSILRPIRGRAAYRVDGDCWLWQGSLNTKGYPLRSVDGHVELVHRVLAGAQAGQSVHHVCEQPSCVNPEHLELVDNEREHKARHGYLLVDQIADLVAAGTNTTSAIHAALPDNPKVVSVVLCRAVKYGVLRRVKQGVYEVAA